MTAACVRDEIPADLRIDVEPCAGLVGDLALALVAFPVHWRLRWSHVSHALTVGEHAGRGPDAVPWEYPEGSRRATVTLDGRIVHRRRWDGARGAFVPDDGGDWP